MEFQREQREKTDEDDGVERSFEANIALNATHATLHGSVEPVVRSKLWTWGPGIKGLLCGVGWDRKRGGI